LRIWFRLLLLFVGFFSSFAPAERRPSFIRHGRTADAMPNIRLRSCLRFSMNIY
jgi:hypothetical protein